MTAAYYDLVSQATRSLITCSPAHF